MVLRMTLSTTKRHDDWVFNQGLLSYHLIIPLAMLQICILYLFGGLYPSYGVGLRDCTNNGVQVSDCHEGPQPTIPF